MARFAFCFILASVMHLGALGPPPIDSRYDETPEEKLSDTRVQFELFKIQFNRSYSSPLEELKRFKIFAEALIKIILFNKNENGTAEYDVNDMADWTEQEFMMRRANLKPETLDSIGTMPEVNIVTPRNIKIPPEFDWRTKNGVTPIKNQGRCGSCWAFSTVSNVESRDAIKNGVQKTFSEQQLVDCDRKSSGCDGGYMDSAIKSIMDKGGLNTADSYPYVGKQGTCKFKSSAVGAKVSGMDKLRSNDEKGMAEYIATTSPIINGINAGMLQYYKRGIIAANSRRCNKNALNHAINLIGYGKDSAKRMDYWIGKNSWGSDWGEKGFFRIERGSNTCGIANEVMSAVVS